MINKLLTLIAAIVLFAINTSAQDSIPNSNFENWYGTYYPSNWQTTNIFLPPGTFTCNKTNNSFEGEWALQMKTIQLDSASLIPAVATLGELGIGYTAGGVAYTHRPLSLKGYFIHPSFGDEVMIAVQFYKNGDEIGGGQWASTDSVADYTLFEIPINFGTSENPDTMNITILTDPWAVGSSITIDALSFELPVTQITGTNENKPHVYPNPVLDQMYIDMGNIEPFSYNIINASGSVVQSNSSQVTSKINTAGLPGGFYLIKINSAAGIFTGKFLKR
ncbi:MAG: T9SS type A sorting domain-containing protein [Bacteroidales bacterium]|nr:T9SS type A sorting domain-containing protein [Bacteroidales bacterium]MCF8402333.1 T9SS type A sorting domain-containing protein [Bacteroidales bacterium]